MKISELKNKSKNELDKALKESQERLRQLRFEIQLKQSKNVREIRKLKRDIAKILTLLNIKE